MCCLSSEKFFEQVDHELLIDPPPSGGISYTMIYKTMSYKKQNDICWPSGSGALPYNSHVN